MNFGAVCGAWLRSRVEAREAHLIRGLGERLPASQVSSSVSGMSTVADFPRLAGVGPNALRFRQVPGLAQAAAPRATLPVGWGRFVKLRLRFRLKCRLWATREVGRGRCSQSPPAPPFLYPLRTVGFSLPSTRIPCQVHWNCYYLFFTQNLTQVTIPNTFLKSRAIIFTAFLLSPHLAFV